MGQILQVLECCCFDRGTRVILREFLERNNLEWEIYLYNIYFLVASLIITLTFHCTLYLSHNEWSRRLERIRGNIKCCSALSWPWCNWCISYISSSAFYLHHVLVLCFLFAFYKNWVSIQGPKSQKVWTKSVVWNSFT